jgi:CRISPR-associated endonuclease/helicase Cas3
MKAYAHTVEGRPEEEWHLLETHLEAVAALAQDFAATFGSGQWAKLAGLWHDLGKYRPTFQQYLRGVGSSGGDHAVVGAWHSRVRQPDRHSLPLSFVIAGHHAGLANRASGDRPRPLKARLEDGPPLLEEALPHIPQSILETPFPALPARFREVPRPKAEQGPFTRSFEFWIRFVFSALVDADYLDTSEFHHPGERAQELAGMASIAALRARLDAALEQIESDARPTEVNRTRAEILRECWGKAALEPGFFSLTVPTGGGKTLAAMSFALRHAERHGLRRVIAVVPFTSIIEQNAKVYRDALGAGNVLEHHSNLDPVKETRRNKLASENWDAPVVVTTGVQFFESLFGNRGSRCRKLHNIAGSVILLDEVQTLPISFQMPILEALRELVAHYRCSIVLSTATHPAFEKRGGFAHGLDDVREIVQDPPALARRLRRFQVTWPDPDGEPVAWPELAAELREEDQVLAVVHQRNDAQVLARLLPEEGRFHLSALMCAAHRSDRLETIRVALEGQRTCRLISTQLIEAGVDVDFPLVYRALGGLDSIVQAGGRANREGKRAMGRVVVFLAPSKPPPGTPQQGLETMLSLLREHGGDLEPTNPEMVAQYFRLLFGKGVTDASDIQREREALNFATVANNFRLIDDDYTRPLVVPYGQSEDRLAKYRQEPTRLHQRALQPYLVNIPKWQLAKFEAAGAVELVNDTVYALCPTHRQLYDPEFGLRIEDAPSADPSQLIA